MDSHGRAAIISTFDTTVLRQLETEGGYWAVIARFVCPEKDAKQTTATDRDSAVGRFEIVNHSDYGQPDFEDFDYHVAGPNVSPSPTVLRMAVYSAS